MNKPDVAFIEKVYDLASEYLIPQVHADLDRYINVANQIAKAIDKRYGKLTTIVSYRDIDSAKFYQELEGLKNDILNIINQIDQDLKEIDHAMDLGQWLTAIESASKEVAPKVSDYQNADRFQPVDGDKMPLRIGKWWKRRLYSISRWPIDLINFFRKLAGKELRQKRPWSHQIHLRNLLIYYFRDGLIVQFQELFSSGKKLESEIMLQVRGVELIICW